MDELKEIQKWFAEQCNGAWEHAYGIEIRTCDNPGWWVKIDLHATPLAEMEFEEVKEGDPTDSQNDWLRCYVKEGQFNGAGDPAKLEKILRVFLEWIKKIQTIQDRQESQLFGLD